MVVVSDPTDGVGAQVAARKKPGPQGTLAEPPYVAKIRAALAGQGYRTWKEAAEAVNAPLSYFLVVVRGGLSPNPSEVWVARLRQLKILELVPRRSAAKDA